MTTALRSIAESWAEFERLVLAPAGVNAGSVQHLEMRRAFYAGAATCLTEFMAVGNDDVDEDAGHAHLHAINDELMAFAENLSLPVRPADGFIQATRMDPGAGYNVRNARIESELRATAEAIKARLPEGWGFTLQIFSYGAGGANFYISTAERDDMLRVMQEFIERHRH